MRCRSGRFGLCRHNRKELELERENVDNDRYQVEKGKLLRERKKENDGWAWVRVVLEDPGSDKSYAKSLLSS